jgi:membrane associated rhomboid family serine protease
MIPIMNTIPSRHLPVVTLMLIAVNSAIFLYQIDLDPAAQLRLLNTFALIPARYFSPAGGGFGVGGGGSGGLGVLDYLPFITMMFLHGGWAHLIFNMWSLWLFGKTVEDRLGPGTYLAFYLGCGVIAGIAHAAFNPTSTEPALGASGAIAGVMGCFIRWFPRARIIILVPVVFVPLFFGVPAFVFIGLWIGVQLLEGVTELLTTSVAGGVAWWAHVGGFVAGFAFASVLAPSQRRLANYQADSSVLGHNRFGY